MKAISRYTVFAFATLSLTLLASGVVFAGDNGSSDRAADPPGRFNACKNDVQQYCADVERGEGRVLACLEKAAVSEGCANQVAKLQEKRALVQTACQSDLASFCADQTGRAQLQCMRQHKSELSEECTAAVKAVRKGGKDASRPGQMKAFRQACGEDVQAFCGEAKGRKEIRACLAEHRGELSASCSAFADQVEARKAAVVGACKDDAERLCNGKSGKALRQCMKENRDQVSEACKDAVAEARGKDRADKAGKKGRKGAKKDKAGKHDKADKRDKADTHDRADKKGKKDR